MRPRGGGLTVDVEARTYVLPAPDHPMPAKKPLREEPQFQSTEKVMQTFRIPRELVTFAKGEATGRGIDLTAYVVRLLDGLRTWFGLPAAASVPLEADRQALGMGREEYLLHLLFHRSLEVRQKGAGFDVPRAERKR